MLALNGQQEIYPLDIEAALLLANVRFWSLTYLRLEARHDPRSDSI